MNVLDVLPNFLAYHYFFNDVSGLGEHCFFSCLRQLDRTILCGQIRFASRPIHYLAFNHDTLITKTDRLLDRDLDDATVHPDTAPIDRALTDLQLFFNNRDHTLILSGDRLHSLLRFIGFGGSMGSKDALDQMHLSCLSSDGDDEATVVKTVNKMFLVAVRNAERSQN